MTLYDTFVSLVFENTANGTGVMHEQISAWQLWLVLLFLWISFQSCNLRIFKIFSRMQLSCWTVMDCIMKAFQGIWFTHLNSRLWVFPLFLLTWSTSVVKKGPPVCLSCPFFCRRLTVTLKHHCSRARTYAKLTFSLAIWPFSGRLTRCTPICLVQRCSSRLSRLNLLWSEGGIGPTSSLSLSACSNSQCIHIVHCGFAVLCRDLWLWCIVVHI